MLIQVKTAATGQNVIKIGLIVQIVFLALFLVTSVSFHIRLAKNGSAFVTRVPWRRHQMALYITSALVFVRSIFRFIEYELGTSGPLLQHEYWSYIFDAALMVIVMLVFNVIYPGEIGDLLRERKKADDGMELLDEQRYETGYYP
jgi:SNF family Na+-dependent transporter